MPPITIKASPKSLLSQSIVDYVDRKMAILDKMLREENDIHVEFDSDKHNSGIRYRAKIVIAPGSSLFAESNGEDIYEAIDLCIPKLREQLLKRKDRIIADRRRLGSDRKEADEASGFEAEEV